VTLGRFFRTPKGVALIVLVLLAVVAGAGKGLALVAPGVASAVLAGMLVDAPILRAIKKRWTFPSGALLTGLIVAMVLSPYQAWYVAAVTSVVGVLSKYLVRFHTANVFNPAALALVSTFYVFHTGQSWWGALPELPPVAVSLLLVTGAFICYRVNKIPAALAFLGAYYLLATVTAFVGEPKTVAELYRAPDVHAALYFAFFMVTDPPTSPPKAREQIVFGIITAAASYAVFELIGAAYFLLAGLLVANAWEGWRRIRSRAQKALLQREYRDQGAVL
jgi:Na+-translocating ferredoxin:NAD+ oxidoreductase RnfD subunit